MLRGICYFVCCLALVVFDSSLTGAQQSRPNAPSPSAARPTVTDSRAPAYRLGTGDQIRVIVFGEEELSGRFEVSSTGEVALPLIGSVRANGLTLSDFEIAITRRLADGYLRNPRVNVEVMNYRPFFILGEVKNPGSFPYVSGMTMLNAVALAGGYTPRARTSQIFIRRGSPEDPEQPVAETAAVLPGDIIRVPERFF